MPARKATKAKSPPARKHASKMAPARRAASGVGKAAAADDPAAVRAWIKKVKPAHRPMVERIDVLIGETMPGVVRAIKWSTAFYGRPGQGWIASMASFKNYLTLNFFAGAKLEPPLPEGEHPMGRRVNYHDMSKLDEKQLRAWLKQAAKLPGWAKV